MIPRTKLTLPVAGRDHILGSIDAPVMLLEYADYECPACGSAYPIVKRAVHHLGDRICFAFRNFPLINIHPHAELAAEAAEAAAAQGKFWEMHDLLFQNQDALGEDDLVGYAEFLGLDGRQLQEQLRSRHFAKRVREDFEAGVRADIEGTPTFFINGELMEDDQDLESVLESLAHPVPHD